MLELRGLAPLRTGRLGETEKTRASLGPLFHLSAPRAQPSCLTSSSRETLTERSMEQGQELGTEYLQSRKWGLGEDELHAIGRTCVSVISRSPYNGSSYPGATDVPGWLWRTQSSDTAPRPPARGAGLSTCTHFLEEGSKVFTASYVVPAPWKVRSLGLPWGSRLPREPGPGRGHRCSAPRRKRIHAGLQPGGGREVGRVRPGAASLGPCPQHPKPKLFSCLHTSAQVFPSQGSSLRSQWAKQIQLNRIRVPSRNVAPGCCPGVDTLRAPMSAV